jgi:hypothetical protein
VLLSIGMSNATQEFAGGDSSTSVQPFSFMGQAAAYPGVNHSSLVLFNGARGGHTTSYFDSASDPDYTRIQNDLTTAGLSEAQVRAVWLKEANPQPTTSLPSPQADAYNLEHGLGDVVRALHQRYPNLQQVFLSSRTYGGYATSNLNPEPYAYETGFSVKWLIESQIKQMAGQGTNSVAGNVDYTSSAPWLAWGPYPWADGMNPRSDGLVWSPDDVVSTDHTHPSDQGRSKVGSMLLNFFLNSEFTRPWFANPNASILPGDTNNDGKVNATDLGRLATRWQQLGNWSMGDFNLDGTIDVTDLGILASHWQQTSGAGMTFDQALAQVGLGIGNGVPEPQVVSVLTAVVMGIGMDRRLRNHR